jgi:hypothetical protein
MGPTAAAALTAVTIVLAVGRAMAAPSPSFCAIVNVANTVSEMSPNDLRDVLLGNRREWPNNRHITVVRHDAGPVAAEVVRSVLGMSVGEYTRHLLQLEFQGKGAISLKAMASDEAVCDFVSNAPGAIGFIPSSAMGLPVCQTRIRVLAIRQPAAKGSF